MLIWLERNYTSPSSSRRGKEGILFRRRAAFPLTSSTPNRWNKCLMASSSSLPVLLASAPCQGLGKLPKLVHSLLVPATQCFHWERDKSDALPLTVTCHYLDLLCQENLTIPTYCESTNTFAVDLNIYLYVPVILIHRHLYL